MSTYNSAKGHDYQPGDVVEATYTRHVESLLKMGKLYTVTHTDGGMFNRLIVLDGVKGEFEPYRFRKG